MKLTSHPQLRPLMRKKKLTKVMLESALCFYVDEDSDTIVAEFEVTQEQLRGPWPQPLSVTKGLLPSLVTAPVTRSRRGTSGGKITHSF